MAEPVGAPIHKDAPNAPDLQAQIDELRVALQDWRRTRQYSQPTEERLAQLTVQCARMVESWEQMEQLRDPVVPGLEGSNGDQSPLPPDARDRIREIERTIEHEWESLGEGHEGQDRRLREQAVSLAESCVAATNLAVRGFERAETRLAALEQDLQGRMSQLSGDLQAVVAELRSARHPALPGPSSAFPLESVMRIHEELRDSDANARPALDGVKAAQPLALPEPAESTMALAARVESLERVVSVSAPAQPMWRSRSAMLVLLAVLGGAALYGVWIQRRVDTRLSEAASRVAEAERQRDATTEQNNARLAAIREEAARQVTAARQSAAEAQVVGNVLAAPDLVRYWLTGASVDSRAYAQILFSRSRGMVFSASRLPPAGDGKAYQLWLLTRGGPVSGGVVTPDAGGRATFAIETVPLSAERRLIGAIVTLEQAGGGSEPSTERVLVRVEPAQPQ